MTAIPHSDRLQDLLADRAIVGLDAPEAEELRRLLAEEDTALREDEFDLAAAALTLALGVEEEPLPERLRERLERAAGEFVPSTPAAPRVRDEVVERPTVIARIGWAPWLIAAAALVIAAIGWLRPAAPTEAEAPLPAQFASLRSAEGTMLIEWQALDDPVAKGATGEVVWNDTEQRGFMRFAGLAPNDPTEQQYQLWIFDATRPEETPVDGGVFDINEAGEVIVPINAKLPVREAAAFAITVERPGGVVVSDRSRLALLAAKG